MMELHLVWEGDCQCKAIGRNLEKCGEIFRSCGCCSTVCSASGRFGLGQHSGYNTGLYLFNALY